MPERLTKGKALVGALDLGAGAIATTGAITSSGAWNINGNATVATGKTLNTTDAAALLEGGIIIPRYEMLTDIQNQVAAASYAVTHTIYVNDSVSGTYQVAAASARFHAAGGSGCTVTVEVAGAGTAPGSGTAQLTAAMSLTGSIDTAVNGAVIGSPTSIAAGSAVNLVFAGTVTGLAGCCVNVVLQRLT